MAKAYPCSTCSKRYKRLGDLQRHRPLCELSEMSKIGRQSFLDGAIPPTQELFGMLRAVSRKVDRLEATVKSQRDKISKLEARQSKIKFQDYLQSNCRPDRSYHEWVESITVNRETLMSIFESKLAQGVVRVASQSLAGNATNLSPLCGQPGKKGKIYAYLGDRWEPFTDVEVNGCQGARGLYRHIHTLVLKAFAEWRDALLKAGNATPGSDVDGLIWSRMGILMVGESSKEEQFIRKLNAKLYEMVKFHSDHIVEYTLVS